MPPPLVPTYAAPWRERRQPPAWLSPVPVRRGRFAAHTPEEARFNVEVAHDLIPTYAFAPPGVSEVLYYDWQTQLLGQARGRLGSGRSGIYRGCYLKGVGLTPAAANWNDAGDAYHASGHCSVSSAIRERLITFALEARGLGAAIVPCRAVLLGRLTRGEAAAVRRARTSSRPADTAGDARFMALTVKPADFARPTNFVFALERFETAPQRVGELFLDLEFYLRPPGARGGLAGTPADLAEALEAAYVRGLENFRHFARAGLHWLYLESNFTLDGRFLDLETPLYFGGPFVGVVATGPRRAPRRELIGFEEFGYTAHWRAFRAWLRARLALLAAPGGGCGPEVRAFVRDVARRLEARGARRHLLDMDEALVDGAVANLADPLGLGRRDRLRLRRLAWHAWRRWTIGAEELLPAEEWRPLEQWPAPATSNPRRYESAAFAPAGATAGGREFAADLARLSALRSGPKLLAALARPPRRDRGSVPGGECD